MVQLDFKKYEKMLWKVSHVQSSISGRDADEFFSLSCLEFAKVSKRWKERANHTVAFSTYLLTSIKFIFINEGIKRQKDRRVFCESRDDFIHFLEVGNSGVSMEEAVSFNDQVSHLSAPAQEVVQIAYNKDHRIKKVNKTSLKAYFKDTVGWSLRRIDAAFQEIENMLKENE